MAFERATPPALRWVMAFLAVCAALGLWLGFKDQIRRNPPAWYTGAPDPVTPGAATSGGEVREATAFDPNAPVATQPKAASTAQPKAKTEEPDEDAATASATPAPVTTTPAAGSQPAQAVAPTTPARPRPATPAPSRPAPSDDPVGDLLDGPRTQPEAGPPVPY